jgi:ABC-type Fe3+-siderophore transport system permease subunit
MWRLFVQKRRSDVMTIVLALAAGALALAAAAIRYFRTGEIDLGTMAAGIAIPMIIVGIVRSKRRQDGAP